MNVKIADLELGTTNAPSMSRQASLDTPELMENGHGHVKHSSAQSNTSSQEQSSSFSFSQNEEDVTLDDNNFELSSTGKFHRMTLSDKVVDECV